MTDNEHAEISQRLALAIGYRIDDVQMVMTHQGSPAYCEVWREVTPGWSKWKAFDYRDPMVIWPIAERFKCFPIGDRHYWHIYNGIGIVADTAALAVAKAVIAAKEKA